MFIGEIWGKFAAFMFWNFEVFLVSKVNSVNLSQISPLKHVITSTSILIGIILQWQKNWILSCKWQFTTSVYSKKTSTEIFTKYNSFTSFRHRVGLIRCMIHTAFKISSFLCIKIFHRKSKYPIFVIDSQMKKFLEIQYTTESSENTVNNNKKVYFKLPHSGAFSQATKINLEQICDNYCKNTNTAVAFSP